MRERALTGEPTVPLDPSLSGELRSPRTPPFDFVNPVLILLIICITPFDFVNPVLILLILFVSLCFFCQRKNINSGFFSHNPV